MPSVHSAQPGTLVGSLPSLSAAADPGSQMLELYRRGEYRELLHRTSVALRTAPDNIELWHIGAAAAYALGLTEDAERFWTVVVTQNPNHAEAHYDLGILYFNRGQSGSAARHLSRAVLLSPDNARAMNSLATLLLQLDRLDEANVLLRRAIALDPNLATAHMNLGVVSSRLNRLAEARICLDEAVRLDPRCAHAHAARAAYCLLQGDEAGAERNAAAALAADPGNGAAHLFRAEQRPTHVPAGWADQLRGAYRDRRSRPVTEQIYLCFAMGKLAERRGEYDFAFQAYAEGNRLHYAQHPWDERGADRLMAAGTAGIEHGLYEEAARIDPRGAPQERVPVFIVGMPRSGTTLLEQILASHPEVFGAGELTTLDNLVRSAEPPPLSGAGRSSWLRKLRVLGEQYLDAAWPPAVRTRFIVDKMPGNYRLAGWIALMMPQAKIIHIRRDPLDTCFSCFATFFAAGHEYTYDQAILARQYARYRRCMQHWRGVLPPGSMLEIDYEALVADLQGVTRSVLAHIGLPWHPACLRFHRNDRTVLTASRVQVRKPLYTSSIGRWRRFEPYLKPMRDALDDCPEQNVN